MLNASGQQLRGLTCCFSKAGLIEGSAPAKIKYAAPDGLGINFAINGALYHTLDSAGDDFWTLSGDTVAIASQCIFLLSLTVAGAASVAQGAAVLTADVNSGAKSLKYPAPAVNVCPVGAIKIVTVGSVFIPGTTSVNGIVTYIDLATLPVVDITS